MPLRAAGEIPPPSSTGRTLQALENPPEALNMKMARLDGSLLLLLGCVFFVAMGTFMEMTNPLGMTDFAQLYFGARSASHHYDPYQPDQLMVFYRADTGNLPADDTAVEHTFHRIVFIDNNLPTTLFLVAPLAILPWKLAVAFWMVLIEACLIFACVRIWTLCAGFAPRFSGILIALLLVNSGLLLSTGNTAGLVIGLTVIAASCFIEDEFIWFGICCLAVALLIKPHDAGPVWLYFLLAGGRHRKRALQTLALVAVIALPAMLWVAHVAPHWLSELRTNLATDFLPGGINDPGPTTTGGRGIGMIISLQTLFALLWNHAGFYSLGSYLVSGVLLVLWSLKTMRSRFSPHQAWLALAAVSALAMLPVYHRTYDARLLVLSIPACALLWSECGSVRRWAMAFTLAGIVLTGDLFWIMLFQFTHYSGTSVGLAVLPAPVTLLAFAVFYLRIYLRSPAPAVVAATPDSREEIGLAASYAR
jgi:hypothetical protein